MRGVNYKKWSQFCERETEDDCGYLHWVCGGIDSHGHVIGHAHWDDDNSDGSHTPEESAITSWRWSVREQRFMSHFLPPKRHMTNEEHLRVGEWLLKHGYTDEATFELRFLPKAEE